MAEGVGIIQSCALALEFELRFATLRVTRPRQPERRLNRDARRGARRPHVFTAGR